MCDIHAHVCGDADVLKTCAYKSAALILRGGGGGGGGGGVLLYILCQN